MKHLTKQQKNFLLLLIERDKEYQESEVYLSPEKRGKECILPSDKRVAKNLEDKGIVETQSTQTGNTFYAFLTKEAIEKSKKTNDK